MREIKAKQCQLECVFYTISHINDVLGIEWLDLLGLILCRSCSRAAREVAQDGIEALTLFACHHGALDLLLDETKALKTLLELGRVETSQACREIEEIDLASDGFLRHDALEEVLHNGRRFVKVLLVLALELVGREHQQLLKHGVRERRQVTLEKLSVQQRFALQSATSIISTNCQRHCNRSIHKAMEASGNQTYATDWSQHAAHTGQLHVALLQSFEQRVEASLGTKVVDIQVEEHRLVRGTPLHHAIVIIIVVVVVK